MGRQRRFRAGGVFSSNRCILIYIHVMMGLMENEYQKDFDGWHPIKKKIESNRRAPTIKLREIWWCSIGINIGVEQDGKNRLFERPVLVFRKFNSRHFRGMPLTTQIKNYPFRCKIYYRNRSEGHVREAQALLSQTRAYDAIRLTRRIARIGPSQFDAVVDDFKKMFG